MAVTVDRRLWLDAEGNLVEDGDPKAAFLWGTKGTEVTDDEAERRGYKARSKPRDKQRSAPRDKQG